MYMIYICYYCFDYSHVCTHIFFFVLKSCLVMFMILNIYNYQLLLLFLLFI